MQADGGNMGQRGVTRPMAGREMRSHGDSGGDEMHEGDGMSHEDRLQMLRMHHRGVF